MNDDPIFSSIEQALHFSFLMEILPVSSKSQMQRMVEVAMKEAGIYKQTSDSRMNFSGMDPLEIRGQCAMIRAAVHDRLPKPEADAIHARFAYNKEKSEGMRGVVDYAAAFISAKSRDAAMMMALNIYGTKEERDKNSVRNIAAKTGMSSTSVSRDIQHIRTTGKILVEKALDRLKPKFELDGIV